MNASGSVRAELAALLVADPSLPGLVQPQPGEPDLPRYKLLCSGTSPYYVVEVPIPKRRGKVWASRLPGARPAFTEAEVSALETFGIQRVVCLVPTVALEGLHGAHRYLAVVRARFPSAFHQVEIPDHQVPEEDDSFERCAERIDRALLDGEQVLVHCVGGCGRTGMFTACLMVRNGLGAKEAIRAFRRCRRCGPETDEQVAYVVRYQQRLEARRLVPTGGLRDVPARIARVDLALGADGEPVRIAKGGAASIYAGRARFEGGGSRRVAVKRFNYPVSDELARRTQECIEALRRAGVRLPPTQMHPLTATGPWVQVSPLFGSSARGSKFHQPSRFYERLDAAERRFVIEQLARVANAGYSPSVDLFVKFEDDSKGVVPLDLELVEPPAAPPAAAFRLLRCILQVGADAAERDRLLAAARAVAEPPLRAALEQALAGEDNRFRTLWSME